MRVDAEFDSASGLWLSVNPNEDCLKYNLLQRASKDPKVERHSRSLGY